MTSSGTIYRSENRLLTNPRATRRANLFAVALLLVGGGLLLAGIGGVIGIESISALTIAVFFGLALVGLGGGAFLLVVLEGLRSES